MSKRIFLAGSMAMALALGSIVLPSEAEAAFHHGGGGGMGYSIHAGMVIVADGTPEAAVRLARVLRNDPGMGVIRHADAGYEVARATAQAHGLDLEGRF